MIFKNKYLYMYVLVNSGEKWTPNKRRKKIMSKRKDGVDEQYVFL